MKVRRIETTRPWGVNPKHDWMEFRDSPNGLESRDSRGTVWGGDSGFDSVDEAINWFSTFWSPQLYIEVPLFTCCGGSGVSIWRDSKAQWECSDCGSVKSNDPNYLYGGQGRNPPPEKTNWGSPKICECGSEKTHGINTGHSSWCPKYTRLS